MSFNTLSDRVVRERIDTAQLWEAWSDAYRRKSHSFSGYMGWERRNGAEYLYRRKNGVVKSLGRRSPETEAILSAFQIGRSENADRLKSLSKEIATQAAILKALNAGRIPKIAGRILREIFKHNQGDQIRVVGTNSLYVYESLAGVAFGQDTTSTLDIDFLTDDRKQIRLLTEGRETIGLKRLIQSKVDKSFEARSAIDYRLTNNKGYMVELIRPEPSPPFKKMPGASPIEDKDITAAPIYGLQWLVNAPSVTAIVPDEAGFPTPMRSPDPRYWMAHKFWLGHRDDRDVSKKQRDQHQATAVMRLIAEKLPQFPLDEAFRASLPRVVRDRLPEFPEPPGDSPDW